MKQIIITYSGETDLEVYLDVQNTPLAEKWLKSLTELIKNNNHLEKNYHFMGFQERSHEYLCAELNECIQKINDYNTVWVREHNLEPYIIRDIFSVHNTVQSEGELGFQSEKEQVNHAKFNVLHRYFEDLQGVSGAMSKYYETAVPEIRWCIRQLNLLCHELETCILSRRKRMFAPEWVQCSELFCFLRASRFDLDPETDFTSFGINQLFKEPGGVYMGINKAVGKSHFEVFCDEGDTTELVTSALRPQLEGSGDFDIYWSKSSSAHPFANDQIEAFKEWLQKNMFDPNDPCLTIGHPKVAQIDLMKSFGTENIHEIQQILEHHLDVKSITYGTDVSTFPYCYTDTNYPKKQQDLL